MYAANSLFSERQFLTDESVILSISRLNLKQKESFCVANHLIMIARSARACVLRQSNGYGIRLGLCCHFLIYLWGLFFCDLR